MIDCLVAFIRTDKSHVSRSLVKYKKRDKAKLRCLDLEMKNAHFMQMRHTTTHKMSLKRKLRIVYVVIVYINIHMVALL